MAQREVGWDDWRRNLKIGVAERMYLSLGSCAVDVIRFQSDFAYPNSTTARTTMIRKGLFKQYLGGARPGSRPLDTSRGPSTACCVWFVCLLQWSDSPTLKPGQGLGHGGCRTGGFQLW